MVLYGFVMIFPFNWIFLCITCTGHAPLLVKCSWGLLFSLPHRFPNAISRKFSSKCSWAAFEPHKWGRWMQGHPFKWSSIQYLQYCKPEKVYKSSARGFLGITFAVLKNTLGQEWGYRPLQLRSEELSWISYLPDVLRWMKENPGRELQRGRGRLGSQYCWIHLDSSMYRTFPFWTGRNNQNFEDVWLNNPSRKLLVEGWTY